MDDLSLHILDMLENSVWAGAKRIDVRIEENKQENTLIIEIEDNGSGFPVAPETAADPFFSTRDKKTGLGLALFRNTAELAGGRLEILPVATGGALIRAVMRLRHINRLPLGDIAASISSIVYANMDIDIVFRVTVDGSSRSVCMADIQNKLSPEQRNPVMTGKMMRSEIESVLNSFDFISV